MPDPKAPPQKRTLTGEEEEEVREIEKLVRISPDKSQAMLLRALLRLADCMESIENLLYEKFGKDDA